MKGKLFGIGVGPGDPELMTVKAARIVGEADIIITPKTEKKDGSVALNMLNRISRNIRKSCRLCSQWCLMTMRRLKVGRKPKKSSSAIWKPVRM